MCRQSWRASWTCPWDVPLLLKLFACKKQNLWSWNYFVQVPDYQHDLMTDYRNYAVVVVIWAVVYLLICCHHFQEIGHKIQFRCHVLVWKVLWDQVNEKQSGIQHISAWHECPAWLGTLNSYYNHIIVFWNMQYVQVKKCWKHADCRHSIHITGWTVSIEM
jgi:hypothetical protein